MAEQVDRPTHYGGTDCIEAMEKMLSREEFIGFLRGTIFRYQWRWRQKNGEQDLEKARWYDRYLKEYMQRCPEPVST